MAISSSTGASRAPAIVALALGALLAGCAVLAGPAEDRHNDLRMLTAEFEPRGLADVIVVTTLERRALRSAVLVGPEGQRQSAYSIDVAPAATTLTYADTEGPLTGPAVSPRLLPPPARVAPIDSAVSRALVALPDPVSYRKTWRQWRIEVTLGDARGGELRQSIEAPPPAGRVQRLLNVEPG